MNRRDFSKVLLSSTILPHLQYVQPASAQPRRWSLRARISECCSCAIPCPCNFGRPTDRGCFGNRLIELQEGDFEGVDLAGAAFLVTFSMGQWTRLYLSDALSAPQSTALEGLLPVAFAGFHRLARTVDRVPLMIERSAQAVSFSVPESRVEMKLLPGLNGEPIMVNGLPSNAFFDYVQFESVVHSHRSSDGEWTYSGTNGFTSEMRAMG
jgi:hypothetical protein